MSVSGVCCCTDDVLLLACVLLTGVPPQAESRSSTQRCCGRLTSTCTAMSRRSNGRLRAQVRGGGEGCGGSVDRWEEAGCGAERGAGVSQPAGQVKGGRIGEQRGHQATNAATQPTAAQDAAAA